MPTSTSTYRSIGLTTQTTKHTPTVHLHCSCVFPNFDRPVIGARCENMPGSESDGVDLCGMPNQGLLALSTRLSRAPRGSGAGNRQARSVEAPCVRYPRSVACRTEARSEARGRGDLIRDAQVRRGNGFALAWGSLHLRS